MSLLHLMKPSFDNEMLKQSWFKKKKKVSFQMESDLMNLPNPLNQSKDWLFSSIKNGEKKIVKKTANKTF